MLVITISALICIVYALNQNAWTFLYSLSAEMSQCQSVFPIGLSHSSYSILCKARFKNFVFLSGLSVDTYSIDSQIGIYFCRLLPLGSHERVCDGSRSAAHTTKILRRLGSVGHKTDFDFRPNVVELASALTRFMLKQ